jgi:hypothetical protein
MRNRLKNGFVLTFVRYRVANNIIIFNELLLLRDHVLQVNNSPSLKLQIEQQLHVLTFQEVVLYHQFQVVLHVVVADARLYGVSDVANLLVVRVQSLLH